MRKILLLLLAALFILSCATPGQRAARLYEQGRYSELLQKYPKSNAATLARIDQNKWEENNAQRNYGMACPFCEKKIEPGLIKNYSRHCDIYICPECRKILDIERW